MFLTNLWTLDPWEIAAIYRMRWMIEIVFRWLKSWLGLIHLISRNWNGIDRSASPSGTDGLTHHDIRYEAWDKQQNIAV